VDRARIVLPDEAAPKLGEDVVVRNLPPGVSLGQEPGREQQPARSGRAVELAINLDLGNDFRVQGRGIETRLTGSLVAAGDSVTEPRLTGVIRTVGGEYRAYGQRLDIERGVLRFTGPVDNPALDILAVRPRLAQRVGVQVTGTAQAPFVRLYAEPDLPEAEKLAWLVLGRPAAAGGAETALLQSAALALLQRRAGGGGSGRGPAALLGLDELGFRRDGADGPAVTLGKRLGRNLYASYERSLSGTLGTLFVFYDLSQRLTVRGQAGERSAVDLIFTFAYD
jgi:translocation and assembly module TamB